MAEGVDIGTLAGKIQIEDQTSSTVDLVLSKVTALEERFDGLHSRVMDTAGGFIVAESAIKLFDVALGSAVDVVKEMTVEGSKIAGVEQNFDRLTEGAGRLGSTLLGQLREGTHNTVSDFNLIKTANSDLAAGVDLTDSQFRTMATGAFALAHSKGIEVNDALESINDAMLTGRVRAVQYLTGRIDTAAAEDKFALSLGTTADRLNAEGKAQASRLAILEAVSSATGKLGTQNASLGDMIAQLKTKWDNLYETIGTSIATSPHVVAAFETVRDVITRTFGGDSQDMVQTVIHWVDYLADEVTKNAPVVANGFISIKTWITNTIQTVRTEWDTLPSWLRNAATEALVSSAAFLTLNSAVSTASGGSVSLSAVFQQVSQGMSSLPGALSAVASGVAQVGSYWKVIDFSSVKDARASIDLLGGSVTGLIGPLGAVGLAAAAVFAAWEVGKTKPVSDFFEGIGLRIQGFSKAEADATIQSSHLFEEQKKQTDAARVQQDAIDKVKAVMDQLTSSTKRATDGQKEQNAVEDQNKFILGETRDELKKRADALAEIESSSQDYNKTVALLDEEMVDAIKGYLDAGVAQDKLAAYYHLTATQIAAIAHVLKDETDAQKDADKAAVDSAARWSDYYAEKLSLSNTTTDKQIAATQKWVAAEIKSHVDARTDTADFYAWLARETQQRTDAEIQDRLTSNNNSKDYWVDQKNQAADAYNFAIQHSDQFTNDYIQGLKDTKDAAADAAEHWQESAGKSLDELKKKADDLKEALDAGFSFDVTSSNLQQTLQGMRTGNDASMGVYYQQAAELAKKGYSFQEIMTILRNPNPSSTLPVPAGPRIPGFRDGGIGDFGDGTLAMLHGKEAIVPLDGHAGGTGTMTNVFHVNGTATDVADQIAEIFVKKLGMRAQFSGV